MTRFLPNLPRLQILYDGTKADYDAAIIKNKEALESLTLDDLMPRYREIDESGTETSDQRLIALEDFSRPFEASGANIVTVVSIDLTQPELPFDSTALVADVQTIYASTKALYLTATRWDRELASPAESVSEYDLRVSTIIHQFEFTEEGVQPVASGAVWGRILNQFSLGEYKGVLRIATTTGMASRTLEDASTVGLSRNHVFTMEPNNGNLEIIGKIENIAPGEKIYSARFLGDRGFLVTFVKIDPLFTLDLSEPTAPKIAGELKVPGYSDYIHPLGENHLLTLGKNAKEVDGTTWYQGIQLSIFDVSDLANPKLVHQEKVGDRGTSSEALYNFKAFTYWADQGLLALPIELREYQTEPIRPWEWAESRFEGLYVYDVSTENGFDLLGRIKTDRFRSWTRGVFIDKKVYAVEANRIARAEINDINTTIEALSLSTSTQP